MPTFTFPGLAPYVEAAATARGADAVHMVKSMALWHCTQVQNALGQLPRLAAHQRPEALAHALKIRDSLAAVLGGIDAAIADVRTNCGLVPPADIKPIRTREDRPLPGKGKAPADRDTAA